MKTAILMTAGIALLAFAGLSGSDHGCNGVITDVGGLVYLDDRTGGAIGAIDHWVYVESNGTPGLQSGGQSIILGQNDIDTLCNHPNPDTLII